MIPIVVDKHCNHPRLEWIDFARGITIILMVLGHTTIPNYISKYIWSFHMPLFFVVSGMMYNPIKYESFGVLLKKKIKKLVIPYFFFSAIVFCAYYGTPYWNTSELYLGWKGYALWFIPVLFWGNLFLFFITRIPSRFFQILVAILGLVVSESFYLLDLHFPFKMEVVPFALFFIIAGFIGKDFFLKNDVKWQVVLICGAGTVVLSQVLPKLDMCINYMGYFGINAFNALLGAYFIFSISKIICLLIPSKCTSPVRWCGRNSLFIMAFSQLFNYWILVLLAKLGLPHIVQLGLRYIILFVSIWLFAEGLKKFTPYLVGEDYKYERSKSGC